jgi:hypothetical protein
LELEFEFEFGLVEMEIFDLRRFENSLTIFWGIEKVYTFKISSSKSRCQFDNKDCSVIAILDWIP